MAGIVDYGTDGERVFAMWESCGIQYRSNIIEKAGGVIPLHAHSYAHDAVIPQGWFSVVDIAPDGKRSEFQVAAKGHRAQREGFNPLGDQITVAAWHQHTFTLIEGPGEVRCQWAA